MVTSVANSTLPRRIAVSDDSDYMLIGEVCEHFRCSRMWVERKIKDPILPFPKGIRFGGPTSARRWRRADVLAWEVARIKLSERH
jgi:predicted DNA-binding transcriptional regulator AlpA